MPGLKMTKRGCIKAWPMTWPLLIDVTWHKAIFDMKAKLERTLGIELETPCTEMTTEYLSAMEGFAPPITYCEVCLKTDISRIHCPTSAQLTSDQMFSENVDYSTWPCRVFESSGGKIDYSYWSMYDDGSICDCGSAFVVETDDWVPYPNSSQIREVGYTPTPQLKDTVQVKFRRARKDEAKHHLARQRWPASTLQSTRCSENVSEERWNHGAKETCLMVALMELDDYDNDNLLDDKILPPSIPAAQCQSRPDISSIFEDETETSLCTVENTYLSWYNGEPIEEEVMNGGDATWCAAKCRANPSCDAWTLNTSNGWCALKRQGQVKKQHRQGFVSGFKTC